MSARFADNSKVFRADWSRTEDLDTGTSDLLEEHTSDLVGVGTEDLPGARAPKSSSLVPAQDPDGATTRARSTPAASATAVHDPASAARQFVSSERREPKHFGPGSILGERFLLEKAVGSGGTALVFSARDLQEMDKSTPRARIAIKVPKPDAKDPDRAISRLQHEFRHAHPLSHANIVRVFELGNDQQTWFMTMELIEGKSLLVLMRDWKALSDSRKRAILRACADALSFAHSREIVHGDFKPANVVVMADGRPKVFDFGAASAASGEDTRIPAGTPAYASPQVLSGMRPEPRDDVFSFGCVAYELLTGQHPFEKRSALEARDANQVPTRASNLSASQWLALLSALSWEREHRPESIESFMQALFAEPSTFEASLDKGAPTTVAPAELSEKIVPTQRGWGFLSFVVVALTVAFFISQRDVADTGSGAESALAAGVPEEAARNEPVEILPVADSGAAQNALMSSIVPMTPAREQKLFSGQGPDIEEVTQSKVVVASQPKPKPAPLSAISFSSDQIVAPEGSIAAVFIVRRSAPLTGRATVQWKVENGSAAIDDDFIASPSGTVEFADGQTQRAIYIPLRNDLDAEGDETFSLELSSPQRGRLGPASRVEATIRDDD
jgi:serine/threonine protein kinase